LGAEEQYTSSRRNVFGTYTGGFFITNLTLLNKKTLKNLEISASVYNLFCKKYNDPASEEHVQKNIGQDGRSFRLKLAYKF
jgi:iron complex outermembrane receptor protein